MKTTDRQSQILELKEYMGVSGIARELGITKQRVYQVLKACRKTHKESKEIYKDTGCPDKLYSSCLNCPLDKCRLE